MARGPGPPDPLHTATLRYRQHGVAVVLEVLEGVFAGAGVDTGTRHLLRWLAAERFASASTVLDVGCGYGPLALWLAAADPRRQVVALDRDARAVEATELGALANRLTDRVEVLGSLGYDAVAGRRFDLVVSNVPAKIGAAALAHLVLDARRHLAPGGLVAIVVIDRLTTPVTDLLASPGIEVLERHPTKAYTALVYRFLSPDSAGPPATADGFARGLYRRGRHSFRAGRRQWEAEVSWSIPEFDSLAHSTLAALDVAPPTGGAPVVLAGVGQGHLAMALRAAGGSGELRLVDRDLLALRTAAANVDGQVVTRHASRLLADDLAGTGLAVVQLPEREPVATTAAVLGPALAGASPRPGAVVLHGRNADVSRVLELLPRHGARLAVEARARAHAHGAVRASCATPPA